MNVAVIMDGNRRYAKKRLLPSITGHFLGTRKARAIIDWALDVNIKNLVLYAFSTENWNRNSLEVNGIFDLVEKFVDEYLEEIIELNVGIKHLGFKEGLPRWLITILNNVEKKTLRPNNKMVVHLALNYGFEKELEYYCKEGKWLFNDEVDLLIRTGGYHRISNFLLKQISYAEIYFSDKLWPEFRKEDFLQIMEWFKKQKRNFGR